MIALALFGAGLGVGTQGTQHFGGGGDIAGAAEGGLGKITLELGIPGLFVVGWFAILVFNYLWRIMRDASRVSPRIARLSYRSFQFPRGQRGSVLGCHAGVWRLFHIVDLELDARFPFGGSGAARTGGASATAGDF